MEDGRIQDARMFATSALRVPDWPFLLEGRWGRLNGPHAWCSQPQRASVRSGSQPQNRSPVVPQKLALSPHPQQVSIGGEYLQVNFEGLTKITKISIQGYEMGAVKYEVTKYKLQYQLSGNIFQQYVSQEDMLQDHKYTVLNGQTTNNTIYENLLDPHVVAVKMRVIPLEYLSGSLGCICMRIELFGCKVSNVVGNVWANSS